MSHAEIHQDYPFPVPPGVINRPMLVAVGNAHQWVATMTHAISQAAVDRVVAGWMAGGHTDSFELDHENLINVTGPVCLKCQQHLTPTTHARPCPIQLVPVIGSAR